MLNWDEIFSAQNWAREQAAVYELVASVLESFEYLSSIEGMRRSHWDQSPKKYKSERLAQKFWYSESESENFRHAKPILL